MITAQHILNEVKILYPRGTTNKDIVDMLRQVKDDMNSMYGDPKFQFQHDRETWEKDNLLEFSIDEYSPDTITLYFKHGNQDEFVRRVKELPLLQKHGWFIRNETNYALYLERASSGKRVKVPRYLYHTTDAYDYDEILDKGLIPTLSLGRGKPDQWHSHQYPPRIFLTLHPEEIRYRQLIFKIDTTKVKGAKFHRDYQWQQQAVWTDSYIPPEAISVYQDPYHKEDI